MNQIIAIVGPTASGKTRLGVELAKALNGEVVSADSMQVYRRMDIGTAKPTAEEKQGVPHHMIDVAEPEENYSVARYVREAAPVVDDILRRGKVPILVGGTGLYVDSLLSGREFAAFDGQVRARLQERERQEGIAVLLEELREIDPESGAKLHLSDSKRILRALEVWQETGKTISQHNRESRMRPQRYEALTIGLTFTDRRQMWQLIDRRVDAMLEQGLCQEIRRLLDDGIPLDCTAMQAIGYKEFVHALTGGGSVEAAAETVKLRSRQYAKRQLTWFRRRPETRWFFWEGERDFAAALQFATENAAQMGIH
jgi:tRNA dimethylallyltransferase